MNGLVEVEYDRRMHEVICAARAAAVSGIQWARFDMPSRFGGGVGWVVQGFEELKGRARHVLLIEWAGARFVYASEGMLLFRIDGLDTGLHRNGPFEAMMVETDRPPPG